MSHTSPIVRRMTRRIMVGNVPVGGDAPISVQSMTNTETTDVAATVAQVRALEKAGADIVRVSVPSLDAAEAFGEIRKQVAVPLVSDIHFDYRIALRVLELGVDCLRINPGNIGKADRVRTLVDAARDKGVPIRIGVNAGSLEKDLQKKYGEPTAEALVESAMRHIDILDKLDFQDFKVSLKASEIFMTVAAYRKLAGQIEQPLHLGITEAGGFRSGTVKSAIGLGMLLADGIGDTIRVRGMNDILPDQTPAWQYLEDRVRTVLHAYGYQEIRLPILEKTELFQRSIGEVTDIVEKEMYTFADRNGDSLTLRPEGTAGCVRAGIEQGLLYNQQQRLWYMGPMFRHERPQKGRYRQFHQVGVEVFGMAGPTSTRN
jgi:hypothetical protein